MPRLQSLLATPQLFGVRAFALHRTPALAAPMPGFYAPRERERSHRGRQRRLARSRPRRRAPSSPGSIARRGARLPGTATRTQRDCSAKPYAAYVFVSAATFRLTEGTDLDVGSAPGRLRRLDRRRVARPRDSPDAPRCDVRCRLPREGAARLRAWAASDPRAAGALRARRCARAGRRAGLSSMRLFKTVDGNMRAYVRAGGPAYDAGLRTGRRASRRSTGGSGGNTGPIKPNSVAYDGQAAYASRSSAAAKPRHCTVRMTGSAT